MRTNTVITLGASVACAALAIFLAKGWIDEAIADLDDGSEAYLETASPVAMPLPGVPVVVAEGELRFGDELGYESLTVVDFPEGSVPMGALASLDEVFTEPGARVVALTRINAGEPVLDFKVSLPGSRAVLSEVLEPGARAATIPVNDASSVAGFVLPGDRVDVLFVRDEEGRSRYDDDMRADVLLQNIKVLGIDQTMDDQVEGALPGRMATLEVTLEESQQLALAAEVGLLSLTLRAIGEDTVEKVASLPRAELIQRAPKRRAYRPPTPKVSKSDPTSRVTVVRGDVRESVSVISEPTEPVQTADGYTPAVNSTTLAGG